MGTLNEHGMIGSIMHADEDLPPTFENKEEEIAYLEETLKILYREADEAFNLTTENPDDITLLDKAMMATNKATELEHKIAKLKGFKSEED